MLCRPRFPEGRRAFQKLAREPARSRGGTTLAPWHCVRFAVSARHVSLYTIINESPFTPAGMGEIYIRLPAPLL